MALHRSHRTPGTRSSRVLTETALTLGAIAGLVCIIGAIAALAFGIRPLIVRSGSMEPALPVGSLALAIEVDATSLHTGDIVSVTRGDGSRITHRVAGISSGTKDTVALQMKGDANTSPDPAPYVVAAADRVVVTVPAAGYVASWLATPPAWTLGALAVLGLGYLAFRPDRRDPSARGNRSAAPAVVATAAIAVTIVVAGVQVRDTAAAFTDTATTTSTFTTSALNFVVDPSAITCTDDAPSQQARLSWDAAPAGYSHRIDFYRGATFVRTVSIGSGTSYTPTAADAPAINPFAASTYSARLHTVRTATGDTSAGYESHDINSTLTCGAAGPPATPASIASFAILAGSGITNAGATSVVGDIGSYPTPTITGTASLTIDGVNHGADPVTQGAQQDLAASYDMLVNQPPTAPSGATIGGKTFSPGVYNATAGMSLSGTVTLDGQGDPNAVFVFQAGSTLVTAGSSSVTLVGGAQACNVFWQVGSSATLATYSDFAGNILVHTSITVQDHATVQGRVLAMGGAVTLDSNSITRADCAAPSAARSRVGATTTSPAPSGSPTQTSTTTTTPESPAPESTTPESSTSETTPPAETSTSTPDSESSTTTTGPAPDTSTTTSATTPSLPPGGLASPTGTHTAYADGAVLSVYDDAATLIYSGPVDPDASLHWQSGTDKLWVVSAGHAELVSETDGIWTHTVVPVAQLPTEIAALV